MNTIKSKILCWYKSMVSATKTCPARIADMYDKKNLVFVSLQFFQSNTFQTFELTQLVNDEALLAQLSIAEIKLLLEVACTQSTGNMPNRIAIHREGLFVYSQGNSETFYSPEQVGDLIEDNAFLKSLDAGSAYLLGKFVAERKATQYKRPKLYLVGG